MVDDEEAFLDQAKIFLERLREDFSVNYVETVDEALDELNEGAYDAIVSDYMMPQKNGLDFLKIIREEKKDDIPFLILTGKGREEVAMKALNLGADRYLQKGGDPKTLYSVLAQAIEQEVKHFKTKRDLDERKKQFEQAIMQAPYPAMLHAEDGEVISVNDVWISITGYEREEISTIKDWLERAYGDEIDSVRSDIGRLYDLDERIDVGVYTIKTKSGERREWDFSSSPIGELPDGRRLVLSMARDVTEKKKVERNLREKNKETEVMLERMLNAFVLFESVFDDGGNFISYRFVYINKAYEEMTGVTLEEVKGKTVHEVWPGTEDEWIERYGEVAVTGESQTFDLYHDPTGKLYHCNVYRPYETKEKFCVIFEDITERKKAEERIEHLNSLLKSIRNVNQIIVQGDDLREIMKGACEALVENRSYLEVTISLLDDRSGEISPIAQAGEHTFKSDWSVTPDGEGEAPSCIERAVKSGDIEIIDTSNCGGCEFKDEEDYHISAVVPMKRGEDVVGFMKVSLERDIEIDEEEKALLREVANDLGFARSKLLAERKLEREKELFETIFNRLPVMVTIYDPKKENFRVNEKFSEVLGWTNEDVRKMDVMEACHPDPDYRKEVAEYMNKTGPKWRTFEVNTKDGRVVESSWTNIKLSDERQIGIGIDLREKKKLEEELYESEERYRRFFETAQDGMLILDAETGKIKDANPYIQDIVGYSKEELVGRELWEIGTFRSVVENRERFKELVEEGYIRYEDLPLKTKEGEEAPVEFVSNTYTAGGERVVQCNIRDITERKKTERALKESEEHLRVTMNSVGEGIITTDVDGNITFMNPRAEELTGWLLTEARGKPVKQVYTIFNPETEERVKTPVKKVLDHNGIVGLANDTKLKSRDGEEYYIEDQGKPIRDDKGDIIGVVLSFRDLTEKYEMNRRIKESEKKYRRLYETMTQGVVYQDADGKLLRANPAAERILGISVEEMRERDSESSEWKSLDEDGEPLPGKDHPSMKALRTG
ncbi:MAG: PAS domain S-box protein, partial [Candidatus Natronoplasma sp.]